MNLRKDHSDFFEKTILNFKLSFFAHSFSFPFMGEDFLTFFSLQMVYRNEDSRYMSYRHCMFLPLFIFSSLGFVVDDILYICISLLIFIREHCFFLISAFVLTSSSRRDLLPTSLRLYLF